MKKVTLFWFDVLLTIAVELTVTYAFFYYTVERGFIYTFRIPVSTEYMTFPFTLLFSSIVFTAFSIGVFRKDDGEVQSVWQFFLSYVQHPIPLGSVILFLTSFLIL
jgi:hypothetical protein